MQSFKRLVCALTVLVCCSPSEMRGQTGGFNLSLPDMAFDGQTTQTIGMYTLPQSFSFEAEVRVDASDQWRHLVEVGGVEYVWNSPFRLEVGNEGQWYVCIGDGYSYVESDFMGEWTYGVWTKVLFTYENGVGKLYENGQLLKEFTANKNVNAVQGSLILGSLQGNQRFFQGAMRNARLVEGTLAPSGTTTSQPPAGGTDPVAAPAISSDGHWVQGSGAVVWQLGWQAFTHVVATNNGVIYGVYPDGRLMWYRHDGYMTGTSEWVSTNGSQVGSGWDQFRLVFAGDQGVLYGVTPDGRLVWYKHDGYQDGSNVWAPSSGSQVGSGWHIYDQVITGNKGLMYGIATDGKLFWYQHTGYLEGNGNWASGSGVQVVGTGWQSAQPAMGGDDGLIYAVMNGELKWYQRPNPESATENWVHDNGMAIGTGWQVKSVFAGDEGTIYAVMPSGELRWYRYNYGLKDDPEPTGSTSISNVSNESGLIFHYTAPPTTPRTGFSSLKSTNIGNVGQYQSESHTVAFWFKPLSFPSGVFAIADGRLSYHGTGSPSFFIDANGVMKYSHNTFPIYNRIEINTFKKVTLNEWIHVAIVYRTEFYKNPFLLDRQQEPNLIMLYLDGQYSTYKRAPLISGAPIAPVLVGTAFNQLYEIYLDDIRIYDRPLSDEEIQTLVNAQ